MNLASATNDMFTRIDEILRQEEFHDFMLERVFRIKDDIITPIEKSFSKKAEYRPTIRHLKALHRAIEEYVVWFQQEPSKRPERRRKVEAAKGVIKRDVFINGDDTSDIDDLLNDIRKWQWKTGLDDQGRLVYATGNGTVIPGRGAIAQEVGIQVIEQACKATRPYSDKHRPRDLRGNPGGLVVIDDAKRIIVVGDLHGRYDNLECIIKDKNNLEQIMNGDAHLIFTGDAVHPRSSSINTPRAYEDSFCVMLLIMTLKAENPFNVHYLIGNHDHAHVGGASAGRGRVRQDALFEKYTIEKFGKEVFGHYKEFVKHSPITAKVKAPNGWLMLVHAGLTPRVLNQQGLINIFMKGRQGQEIRELLWSRNYDKKTLEECLERIKAKFIISGHTTPTKSREEKYGIKIMAEGVFAQAQGLQIILNAQRNIFGYLDVDVTKPLPDHVTSLKAPDGKPAFRMLRPV